MKLTRIDRKYATLTVNATLDDGTTAAINGVDIALLPPRTMPGAATTWTAATAVGAKWRVLLTGPDATGGIAVLEAGADLWIRVTDSPEVITAFVSRIEVV